MGTLTLEDSGLMDCDSSFDIIEVQNSIFSHGVIFQQNMNYNDDLIELPVCKCCIRGVSSSDIKKCQTDCNIQLSEILNEHYEQACPCKGISTIYAPLEN